MKRLIAGLLLWTAILAPVTAATVFRVDPSPAMTTSGNPPVGGFPVLYAVAGAAVNVYSDAAASVLATTYADSSGNTACPAYAQVVPAGGSCVSVAGSQGQFGFWLAAGTYYYTITPPGGARSVPYPISVPGTANTADWVSSLTSRPVYDNRQYNFAVNPSVALSAGIQATIAMTPCPLGLNGSDSSHYLYVSGTGVAETVLVNGGACTSGAATGTVKFTPAGAHAVGYALSSATCGLHEAGVDAIAAGGGAIVYAQASSACIVRGPTLFSFGANDVRLGLTGSGPSTTLWADPATLGSADLITWAGTKGGQHSGYPDVGNLYVRSIAGAITGNIITMRAVDQVSVHDIDLRMPAAAGVYLDDVFSGQVVHSWFASQTNGVYVAPGNTANNIVIRGVSEFYSETQAINCAGLCQELKVEGNHFEQNFASSQTTVKLGTGCDSCIVSGNSFNDNGNSDNTTVQIGSSGPNAVISGNTFENMLGGALISAQSLAAITGNIFHCNGSASRLGTINASNISLTGNQLALAADESCSGAGIAAGPPVAGWVVTAGVHNVKYDNYYVGTESGSANVLAFSMVEFSAPQDGLCVTLKIAHTLQAGANTLNLGGSGAVAIKSHITGGDLGTAMTVVPTDERFCYYVNGGTTLWLNMGQ